MRKLSLLLILIVIFLFGCNSKYEVKEPFTYIDEEVTVEDTLPSGNGKKVHVVLLYGQSNADGCSLNEYLKKTNEEKYNEYKNGYDNVLINFYNDQGQSFPDYAFEKCDLGCGYSPAQFGPEMGIADVLSKAYPNETIFIIKRTWGGTALKGTWLDDNCNRGFLYNSAMDFTYKCLDYLQGKGYDFTIDGICWMQGESDCAICDKNTYYQNTLAFVSLLRYDLAKYQKDIKFIDALISDIWDNYKAINDAKRQFAKESKLYYLIDTSSYTTNLEPEGNADIAHYDSLSMIDLGQSFGRLLNQND